MVLMLVLTMALTSGVTFTELDNDYENWYPHKSTAWGHYTFQKQAFGKYNRTELYLVEDTVSVNGVLTKSVLEGALALHNEIAEQDSYSDLCVKYVVDGPCVDSVSILALWNYDASVLSAQTQAQILQTVNDAANANLIILDAVLGGLERDSNNDIVSAIALQVIMSLHVMDGKDDELMAFEKDNFMAKCNEAVAQHSSSYNMYCNSFRSYSDESDRAIEADQSLMMFAMLIMIAYVAFVLKRKDMVESKMLLGLLIVVNVGLSLGVAFGICGFLGLPFTQMSMMCIFIIMGVGIDDMFILTDAFDREPPSLPSSERVANALAEVGGSITLTSVTDFLAFSIGSTIDLPAVSYFCVTAALAVMSVFLIQITFFAACLAIDARRILNNRYDLLPCFVRKQMEDWGQRENAEHNSSNSKPLPMASSVVDKTPLSPINVFADFIVRPVVSKVAIFLFLVLGAGMSYQGFSSIEKGIKITDFLPAGSYVGIFYEKRDLYFGEIDTMEFITTATIDPSSADDRAKLSTTFTNVENLSFTVGTPNCWFNAWQAFDTSLSASTSESDAQASFDNFMSTDEAKTKYANNMVFNDDGKIVTSKCNSLFLFATMDVEKAVDEMYQAREATISGGGEDFAFAFNQNWLWMERYITIDTLTVNTLMGALVGVFVVCVLFLDVTSALLVCVCVVLINVNIIGLMSLWDVRLNVASLVILILSVGFSVDYSAHVAEGYLSARTKGLKAKEAVQVSVREMGVSVLNGGISTLLAVVILSASKSEGFVVLFKMFLGMVTFGLLHGIVLLPAMLLVSGQASEACGTGGAVVKAED
ncbi:hypothetical protein TrVE_jg6783 [Triparma verrucosa]|uniref:SSD domain-containing protein n=1 Tax=Triparma verrucosa TaxID=1606542 RepID=A0A9W7ESK4_9STRA|nr:hypothetical protein TrVE_jg6783 [Triparma verrucosa]